ncbi:MULTISPECIES: hypothetical protein [Paraburkholderia]|uniref:Uncharacterized protein n=1 Tax=Paraburkholderia madseniana TaxID=2599607 RepID=A0AAP5BL76_9BURK|nr:MULTISPECIES: hypothetical protein [Paraburkholderia]MCX4150011.1 hypothetical protein [Paraburkholderia madseniana]MCX4177797.1 hypothetical protein [Paraburkholderia madseniana]MDN7152947.1 hypothetical protein [Paraburkholderia sp. WS6]MDQ6411829.1 hypothetical protein [Paraburkholderia madseniana]MDQ6465784.1 hypothetical protein [Paraburkholderia madseniana]
MQIELCLSAETIATDAIATAMKATAHAARVARVFDAMRGIVEKPDARLKHYTVDFYEHDRAYLQRTYATGQYGWVVRESGTHLVQLGRHPRMNEELDAALRVGPSRDCYLIDARAGTVMEVTEAKLREEMSRFTYVTGTHVVGKNGRTIAMMDVSMSPWAHANPPQGIVRFRSLDVPLTHEDLVALAQIGASEVIRVSHSLLTGTQTLELDGENLLDLIEQRAE